MRIGIVHWGFPPIIGGVETHLVVTGPEMVKMGHEVFLLTGAAEGSPENFEFEGMKVIRKKVMDLNWLFKSQFGEVDSNLEDVFDEFLNIAQPDIFHAHNMHYFCQYHARNLERIAKENNIPLVLTAHNCWTDKTYVDLTTKIGWDHIISISEYITREITAVGFPKEKVSTLWHGVDEKLFTPGEPHPSIFEKFPALKTDRPIVFCPARSGLSKGCDIAVEALRLIKEEIPDVLLVMAGSKNIIDWGLTQNKDLAFIVNLVHQLKLEDNFYIDCYNINEMPEIYRLSDVVIYPSSVEEPFGLVMLESMATAKPIVVTDSGGMPEIIFNDVNGFVVKKRHYEALAEKCIKLLKDKALSKRLGETGRKLVEEKYTKRIITQKMLNVYEQMLQKNKAPRQAALV